MARVAGVDIPLNKRVVISLRYIYGVGPTIAAQILKEAQINPNIRVKDLSDEDLVKIRSIIEKKYSVEGSLRRQIGLNIRRQKETGSYRGLRHIRNLPVRGQRTRTNARTKKGRRPIIGGMKKKELS